MEIYHDSHEDALRYIHKSDHSRKSYYEVISKKIWGDKSNYDLCLDCKLGNETIIDIICNYVKSLNNYRSLSKNEKTSFLLKIYYIMSFTYERLI